MFKVNLSCNKCQSQDKTGKCLKGYNSSKPCPDNRTFDYREYITLMACLNYCISLNKIEREEFKSIYGTIIDLTLTNFARKDYIMTVEELKVFKYLE